MLVHTGQHFDPEMSDIFFEELGIRTPDRHLGIAGGSHGEMTGRMLAALEGVMLELRPDAVLVYGDTNSTLAGALAAAKLHLPIAHVEAGMRSFNRSMPEEINRVLSDHVSTWLFCSTRTAIANLEAEGIRKGVYHVGDVMYDVALLFEQIARETSDILTRLELTPRTYAVATVHRAENTDDVARLAEIIAWLQERSHTFPVIFLVHPRTRQRLDTLRLSLDGLRLHPPIGYVDMARLVSQAAEVYTDSGGLQKEAYFHGVPCVTLREETEWVETIECGWNRLWKQEQYRTRRPIAEYGEGRAAQAVLEILLQEGSGAQR